MDSRSVPKGQKETTLRTFTVLEQFNPAYTGSPGVENNEPSMTIPDMSYTIQELLLNHTRGIEPNVKVYKGEFFGVEIPQFDDIIDRIAYKEELLQQIKAIEDEIKQTELSVSEPEIKTSTEVSSSE